MAAENSGTLGTVLPDPLQADNAREHAHGTHDSKVPVVHIAQLGQGSLPPRRIQEGEYPFQHENQAERGQQILRHAADPGA